PNLDRRIRQGDALLDPLDLGEVRAQDGGPDRGAALDSRVRRAFRALTPAGARYLTAEPAEKQLLKRELARRERQLATAWLAALDDRLGHRIAELRSIAATRDLWGDEVPGCAAASASIPSLSARREELAKLAAALEDGGTLPFFSFRVHFAESAGGFDLVVSNPPWVRAHRWPASVGRLVRRRYAVCREPGWRYGATLAGAPVAAGAQVDLSQLFLERSLALLAHGGVLAMLIPAKTFRSLYGGPARQMLLRETRLAAIEDHSLDQRSVFQADAFAGAIIACKNAEQETYADGRADVKTSEASSADVERVRVTLLRRGVSPLRFDLPQQDLPLFPGDLQAPWLLAPEHVRRALRRMQAAGPPLGTVPALRVRRGVFTGANHVLLVREATPRLSGLCQIRAEGFVRPGGTIDGPASSYEAIVETECLRPLVRGCDVGAWRYRIASYVIWVHDDTGKPTVPPPRLRRYLARHDDALRARSGSRPGSPAGSLFRVSSATLSHKVVWHDLAETLNAVAIPAAIRSPLGVDHAVVPLNTVYFIATADAEQALLLAAYFNSLPVRTFARAVAERAKDARFRFFAWTVAALPLPLEWRSRHGVRRLQDLSRKAHADGAMDADTAAELDDIVRSAYGLGAEDARALAEYDAWLRGAC
ncbi:MAG: Eco57I restriction-modification methylase domain-containing protein, partial [Longimicrobiales bacterium]